MRVIIVLLLLITSFTSHGYSVGSQLETVSNGQHGRPLKVRIFYPSADAGVPTLQGANAVFGGFSAIEHAHPADGRFPLIVLSHGSGGNNTSLAWLAVPLAARGAIVIAASHPGSTTGDSRPQTDLTLQIRDLSQLISHYLQAPAWRPYIDRNNVGAIGHSKGGYSVLALAGAQVTRESLTRYCQQMPQMPDCQFYQRGGVQREQTDNARLAASYRDTRVKWMVALDPGMSYAFTPASLQSISVPLRVIAAGYYIRATGDMTLGAERLPLPVTVLKDAGHYDFLPLCQPTAQKILAGEEEGEAFICETPAAERELIHRQTIAAVGALMQRVTHSGGK
ncbi:alpha/beta fold hydrolase [Erwinia sp. Leaf53]|uniref:alpha/beta hydrolase family protein n=1 Tax=Erwinia sp. Leaf53 TaxID=1736225 RepID=UPI0006F3331C|nr:alpha/beta fold hydrolase [Erwinia sp. Leaf53]KQN55133.1 hypothetical protein ASF13_11980 [Erwinia sp. Leaf53]